MGNLIFGTGLSSYKDNDGLKAVCKAAFESGIRTFDTAPSYRTEIILSQVLSELARELNLRREDLTIQTKIDPIQMYNGHVESYLEKKLKLMNLEYIDHLLIHWPVFNYLEQTWSELVDLKKNGIVKRIGICNLRVEHLAALEKDNIIPDILQIERHPLNTFISEVDYCHEHDIELQVYSPLCKMHPLIKDSELLKNIAKRHNTSIGCVILRWHLMSGCYPVFTSKNVHRIKEYANCMKVDLSKNECLEIDNLNINHKLYLESLVCPGF